MKSRYALLVGAVSLAMILAACGPEPAAGGSPASPSPNPDEPVTSTPCPLGPEDSDGVCGPRGGDSGPRYQIVTPRPGMADLHPVGWHRATARGATVLVRFWSGVEPCYVLDHVEVVESSRRVVITLYEGHDPHAGDVACIEIAQLKAVEVQLDRPLGDRRLVDGSSL
jgi:hypothetical protein